MLHLLFLLYVYIVGSGKCVMYIHLFPTFTVRFIQLGMQMILLCSVNVDGAESYLCFPTCLIQGTPIS